MRTRKRAFERMVAYLEELRDRGASDWCVQHAQAGTRTPRGWSSRAREILGSEPLFCTQVGPVLGAHLGLGSAGRGRRRGLGAKPGSLLPSGG